MRRILLVLLMCSAPVFAWTDEQDHRWRTLNEELRCLVCQNQSIAESNAPLAEDLRNQARLMIEQGKSDQEIRLYMTQRYGDFVLYRPPFNPRTWLLWIGPALMLLLGLLLIWRLSKTKPTHDDSSRSNQSEALSARLKALDDE